VIVEASSPDDAFWTHGRFVAPALRNVAVTAPYMHDGSVASLSDVLDRYAAGGRGHPHQDPLVRGFRMTPGNKSGPDRVSLV
jgi:cytochrome c peroxidase